MDDKSKLLTKVIIGSIIGFVALAAVLTFVLLQGSEDNLFESSEVIETL